MTNMRMTVGIGAGSRYLGVDHVVDLGPLHPTAHGALRLRLRLHNDIIIEATPIIGQLHRGAEKLFEVRDYRQVMALANRHDWLAAFCNELAVALAVERLMGIEVPQRAQWLRVVLCELNRIMAYLLFLTPVAAGMTGEPTELTKSLIQARESVQRVLEEATGGRIHFMFNRIGGVRDDLPDIWFDHVLEALSTVDVTHIHTKALAGIGILSTEKALALGVTGPIGRACGLDLDLRRHDPLLPYQTLDVQPITRASGDAQARVECLIDEVTASVAMIKTCLAALPGGPVNVRLPKNLRAPQGSVYSWVEAPLGVSGVYLSSRGEKTPWRLKLRTPSFNNVQALAALLPGTALADLPMAIASFAIVIGDIDK